MSIAGAGEGGQQPAVDVVALLETAHGAGKLAGPLRVDDGDLDAGIEQFGSAAPMIASGGFDEHQADVGSAELLDELCDATLVIDNAEGLVDDIDEAVQGGLGNIDAGDGLNGRFLLHGGLPALRMRTVHGLRLDVQPAVGVRSTRPATITLRGGVVSTWARSICRRPPRSKLLATLRSLLRGMRH